MCSIEGGKSIDTTMGMTPLEGCALKSQNVASEAHHCAAFPGVRSSTHSNVLVAWSWRPGVETSIRA